MATTDEPVVEVPGAEPTLAPERTDSPTLLDQAPAAQAAQIDVLPSEQEGIVPGHTVDESDDPSDIVQNRPNVLPPPPQYYPPDETGQAQSQKEKA